MIRTRHVTTLLALASIATLPACSMFGGGSRQASNTSYPSQSYAATPGSEMSSAPQSAELTADTLRSVQQSLQQDNLYHGQVDGIWGPETQSAVRSYQQQHNLNVTGQLDPDTLAAMNLGPQQQPSQRYGSNEPPNYNPPPNNNPPPNPGNTH